VSTHPPAERSAPGKASPSTRKVVIQTYFDGFRQSDHERILACLADDVAWDLPGYRHLTGRDAFDREIENTT
jgi:uncharacterized protein